MWELEKFPSILLHRGQLTLKGPRDVCKDVWLSDGSLLGGGKSLKIDDSADPTLCRHAGRIAHGPSQSTMIGVNIPGKVCKNDLRTDVVDQHFDLSDNALVSD